MMRYLSLMMFAFLSFVFADDPAWLTNVNTQLTSIEAMIGGVIVALVGIFLAPIAWSKIKHVLNRG